jgi:hypothetical protein
LGAIAKPDEIRFADNLPKTRSGKIMRRLLRSIARGEPISQDVSTLENPGILDQLRGVDTGAANVSAPNTKAPHKQTSKPAKNQRDTTAGTVTRKLAKKAARKAVKKAARKK